jgi:hypothetical protein
MALLLACLPLAAQPARAQTERPGFSDTPLLPGEPWRVHDSARPYPARVDPGSTAGAAPADAVPLFDGRSQAAWRGKTGPWMLADGALTVPPRAKGAPSNDLVSVQGFGDVQLHLEFRIPPADGTSGQDRGNSGVWFMQRYEVQILDGVDNPTYADGMVGSLYGQAPPLVNAALPKGEWQSYDIVFERPRFAADGKLLTPAFATVFLNGVLVQNRRPFLGTTIWRKLATYTPHADRLPIMLQDHSSPVSFRNIWVRELPESRGDTK